MKYRLKKDLPQYPSGTVFELETTGDKDNYWVVKSSDMMAELPGLMQSWLWEHHNKQAHAGWFEPIKDKPTRWRAPSDTPIGKSRQYWMIDIKYENWVNFQTDTHNTFNDLDYESGNYFRTREQAEAVAEAIKKLLEYAHTPFFDTAVAHQLHSNVISKTASVARRAVQEDA